MFKICFKNITTSKTYTPYENKFTLTLHFDNFTKKSTNCSIKYFRAPQTRAVQEILSLKLRKWSKFNFCLILFPNQYILARFDDQIIQNCYKNLNIYLRILELICWLILITEIMCMIFYIQTNIIFLRIENFEIFYKLKTFETFTGLPLVEKKNWNWS